jgi:hypothetical protein
MTIRCAIPIALLALAATPALAEEPHRQLGAHTHGEGRLAIAIEAGRVQMELETPASDIVGFEHAPSTPEQEKALADAKDRLAKAAALFVLAPAAGCTLTSAAVEAVGALGGSAAGHEHAHDDHDEEDKAQSAGKSEDKAGEEAHEHGAHSEIHANYAFDCAAADKLSTIAFEYFRSFKGADKLDVTVIGPKGQSSFVVTREKPILDLAGLS